MAASRVDILKVRPGRHDLHMSGEILRDAIVHKLHLVLGQKLHHLSFSAVGKSENTIAIGAIAA
eukprot:CAMPEP_0170305926 /NCGR_PEP_ID=MMETSP0116_2-20130129/53343_1 /TAXON_ID=400756 /ORGANISM="Durinskia baltica, Strain CSIRO CS-38" /LENGTH=63 /DNA_ID=CAMNT_0010557989 /DNA_START=280 /DNA_END=469 /DNA_ORIENTATION=+